MIILIINAQLQNGYTKPIKDAVQVCGKTGDMTIGLRAENQYRLIRNSVTGSLIFISEIISGDKSHQTRNLRG